MGGTDENLRDPTGMDDFGFGDDKELSANTSRRTYKKAEVRDGFAVDASVIFFNSDYKSSTTLF